jgi:hypothetical protein
MINELPFIKSYYSSNEEVSFIDLNSKIEALYDLAVRHRIVEKALCIKPDITLNDFVENSVTNGTNTNSFVPKFEENKYHKGKLKWGKTI